LTGMDDPAVWCRRVSSIACCCIGCGLISAPPALSFMSLRSIPRLWHKAGSTRNCRGGPTRAARGGVNAALVIDNHHKIHLGTIIVFGCCYEEAERDGRQFVCLLMPGSHGARKKGCSCEMSALTFRADPACSIHGVAAFKRLLRSPEGRAEIERFRERIIGARGAMDVCGQSRSRE
jgi:hypothetical protein